MEPYAYPEGPYGRSVAFDDARALIAWRYGNNGINGGDYGLLAAPNGIFADPNAFINNGADNFAVNQVQQTTFNTNYAFAGFGNTTWPWLGSPNTNNFFSSPAELFNSAKSSLQFATNLYSAGTNVSTYDRYTFYRLLGQLG